jgi:hypothetical protein
MEEIARRRPVDLTAARVTQPGPRGLDLKKRPSSLHGCQPAPWPLRAIPGGPENLIGRVRGSLTVVGLSHVLGGAASGSRLRWCCRCVCGYYVLRARRAIVNPANTLDACDRCLERQWLQHQQQEIASGAYVPTSSRVKFRRTDRKAR